MGALRLDPAVHFEFKRNGISIWRGRRSGIKDTHRHLAASQSVLGRHVAPCFGKIRNITRAISGRVGIRDILSDHGLSSRGMSREATGQLKYLEPVKHLGFSHFGYTKA